MRWFVSRVSTRTIGPDKLNQLRHVRVLRDHAGIVAPMERHRRLLARRKDRLGSLIAGAVMPTPVD